MIKKGFKNYFFNLKYYFTPLGILALSAILGLSIAIPLILTSIRELIDFVSSIDNVHLDFSAFLHKILDAVLALDWRSPSKAISTVLSSSWLNSTFADSIFALVHDVESLAQQILDKINTCVHSIVTAFGLIIACIVLGIFAGYFLTKYLIRKEIAKRTFWKSFLITLLDAFITALLPALVIAIGFLWQIGVYILIVLLPVLWGFILLAEAYFLHGKGKVKAKEVITAKNSAKLLLTNLLIFLIASVFTSVLSALAGELLGLFLGLPLMEIALIVCGLNAESYVKEFAEQKAEAEQEKVTESE